MTSPEVARHLDDVDAIVVSVATATTRRRGRNETTGIRIRGGVRVVVFNPSVEQSQAGIAKRRPSEPATIGDAALAGRVECGVLTRTIGYALLIGAYIFVRFD
jgi:hypothetical protein